MGIMLHQARTLIKLCFLCSFISSFSFHPRPGQATSSASMYMSTQHQSSRSSTIPFAGITFSDPISTSLASMGIVSASPIQKAAISDLVNGLSAILHSETGSGKTLAYILPLLKKLEITFIGYQNTTPPIQAFIIVPTKELAVQVAADIISLLGKTSLMKSTGTANDTPSSEFVHLCLSTNRQGLDNVQSPIVIGTPAKIVDAMRMSSANTFKSIHYIVLDEVDRLLSVMGKYATAEEKQKANDTDNPTEMILSNILMRVKKIAVEREAVQIVAVSATIGRPLRRELCRIVSGGTTFEGNFLVIRGNIKDDSDNRNNKNDVSKKLNNKRSNDNGNNNNSVEDLMESSSNNNSNNNNINSNRKVGIPSKIKHQCVLVDCEIDDISTKIVKAKEKWLLYNKINDSNNNNNSNGSNNDNSTNSNRGILFVPRQADVKQVVGMLRFWGLKECVDLQVVLGLENAKPIGNTQQGVSSSNNNRRIYNNRGAGDNKKKAAEIERNRVPEVQRKVSDIIALAQKSGLGASSLITTGSSDLSGSSETGEDDDDDEISQLINQQVQLQQQQNNNNQQQQNEDALFVAPVSNARGLHLQNIETVLITHCPKTMDEYLHMAGRTGRMSAMPLAKTSSFSSSPQLQQQSSTTVGTAVSSNDMIVVSSKKNKASSIESRTLPSSNTARRSTVISFVNYDELKRLQSWQVPLGIELEILFD